MSYKIKKGDKVVYIGEYGRLKTGEKVCTIISINNRLPGYATIQDYKGKPYSCYLHNLAKVIEIK